MRIKVICIDDTFKPNEIPSSKWIKKDKEYTIIKIDYMNQQNRILGCQLEEIDLSDCFPYLYFRLSRFGIIQESDEEIVNEKILELEYS